MRVNKKGINRLALDVFINTIANRQIMFGIEYKDSPKDAFNLGIASDLSRFLENNLVETDPYNFLSEADVLKEVSDLLELGPVEVWDFIDAVDYWKENSIEIEDVRESGGELMQKVIEDRMGIVSDTIIETPDLDMVVEARYDDPEYDTETGGEDPSVAVRRHLI